MKPAGTNEPTRFAKRFGASPAGIAALSTLLAVALPTLAAATTLTGHVRYEGTPPARPTIHMSADPACDKIAPEGRPADTMVVDSSGGLANVLVYVKSGLSYKEKFPAPTMRARIDQKGCIYVPHVIGVRTGQEIEIYSGDNTFHNVNAKTTENTPFNVATPTDTAVHRSFSRPEVAVKLKCDIHPWMSAYVGVFDHPFFAVTKADGSFELPLLPEGDYTIEAWHESLGVRSAKVKVDDGKPATVDFSFAGN